MRIDGAQGIGGQGLPEPGKPAGGVAPAANALNSDAAAVDSQVLAGVAPYIRQANESEPVNAQAVAEARELLRNGQLDTPDAVRRAAQAILDLGT